MKKIIFAALWGAIVFPTHAQMVVELSASANVSAPNDMVKVTVFLEESGKSPAHLARVMNPKLSETVQLAKSKANVRVKTTYQRSYPVYEKTVLRTWRMRAEIELESEDIAAVSELVGELQEKNVGVDYIQQMPSAQTRRKKESEATRLAIEEFQARAKEIADVFKKPYKIKSLNVNQERGVITFRSNAFAGAKSSFSEDATIEAGESQISTHINGTIEIAQ